MKTDHEKCLMAAHYEALPTLIAAVHKHCDGLTASRILREWDRAREAAIKSMCKQRKERSE